LEDEREYNIEDLRIFVLRVMNIIEEYPDTKVYWKDSINKLYRIRSKPHPQIVQSNYNLFSK